MSSTPPVSAPPIDALISEIIATLAYAGNAYLADETGDRTVALDSAQLACDLAAGAFDRIASRLEPAERTALSGMIADLRMSYVRKRGV